MKHLQANADDLERGKEAILAHVKKVIQDRSLDPSMYTFEWSYSFSTSEWRLAVALGKNRRAISFLEQDVRDWTGDEELSSRYSERILNVIERLKAK